MLALRDSWFSHSDFMPFGGGMDAEIAELKTMTRVTKMRQQIECREEGEWMVIRDVPDEKAKGGTRKVTSYGRASRSVSRSYSGNIGYDIFNHKPRRSSPSQEVIIEYPEEVKVDPPKRIEIEEIQEKEDTKKEAPLFKKSFEEKEPLLFKKSFEEKEASSYKKSSFDEKEPLLFKKSEKDPLIFKKLSFEEKEDTKKAIYEEKEPLLFKKSEKDPLIFKKSSFEEKEDTKKSTYEEKEAPIKKTSVVTLGKGNLILLDGEDSNFHVTGISKGKVADAVSTLERISGDKDKKVKKVGFSKTEVHFAPDSGRVNIVETDEKPPPSQVLRRKRRPKVVKKDLPETYFGEEVNKKVKEHVFPVIREPSPLLSTTVASLTQEKLGLFKSDPPKNDRVIEVVDKKLTSKEKDDMSYLGNVSPKLNKLIQNSLLYDFQPKLKTQNPSAVIKLEDEVKTTKINITEDSKKEVKKEPLYANREIQKEKSSFKVTTTPKPKPRTSITKVNVTEKEKINKNLPERPVRKTNVIKSTEIKKEGSIRSVKTLRSSTPKSIEPPRRTKIVKTEPKVQKVKTDENETPSKKIREPLRSFEKVSNGWVGHCIVPLKSQTKETEKSTQKIGSSVQTGVRRTEIRGVKNLKTTLATNKFSLSKEHLKSAKLVKEISKDKEQRKDLPRSKVESRVGLVSRRRMRYEDSNMRSRRDSDRSDDSVVKADEEVRAYMFHTKHK